MTGQGVGATDGLSLRETGAVHLYRASLGRAPTLAH
jgi:hypothetical protein